MILYFDASALVKRYVHEEGSEEVARLLGQGRAATARLTATEITSALARRHREGVLPSNVLDRLLLQLNADLGHLVLVELTPAVTTLAQTLLRRHPLRAADALQLASALHLNELTGRARRFVCFDRRLTEAAEREGLLAGGTEVT